MSRRILDFGRPSFISLNDILAGTSRRLCYRYCMIPLLRATSSAVAGRVRPRSVAAVVSCCLDTGAGAAAAASSSTASSPPAPPLTADPRYVDSAAAPASFPLSSAVVYPDAISECEADALVQDIQLRMKRRRYEKGHWDAAINNYKEIELPLPSELTIGGGGIGGGGGQHSIAYAMSSRRSTLDLTVPGTKRNGPRIDCQSSGYLATESI